MYCYNLLLVIVDGMFCVGDILVIGYVLYLVGGYDEFWKDQVCNFLLGLVLLLWDLCEVCCVGVSGVFDYLIIMGEVLW